MQHSLGGLRPMCGCSQCGSDFNVCLFIQGAQAFILSCVTEEVVTPRGWVEGAILAAETTVSQQGWAARLVPAVCSTHVPCTPSTDGTPHCALQSPSLLTGPFVLLPGTLFPSVSDNGATAQQDVSTLHLCSSLQELGALWAASSVLRWLNNH